MSSSEEQTPNRSGNAILGGAVFLVVFACAWFALPRADKLFGSLASTAPRSLFTDATVAKARSAAQSGRSATDDFGRGREALRLLADFKVGKVSPALMKSAENDAPNTMSYVRYATIDREPLGKFACSASRTSDGVEHMVVFHTSSEVVANTMELEDYVRSGCAEAIRDRSRLMTRVQYLQTLGALLPRTAEYDSTRASLALEIRQANRMAGR